MFSILFLYGKKSGELNNFLSRFYNTNLEIYDDLKWSKKYTNPIELAEMIGIFIDNNDSYQIKHPHIKTHHNTHTTTHHSTTHSHPPIPAPPPPPTKVPPLEWV